MLNLCRYFSIVVQCHDIWQEVLEGKDWKMLKILELCKYGYIYCEIRDKNLSIILFKEWPNL